MSRWNSSVTMAAISGDGSRPTTGGASGQTELHVLSAASDYQGFVNHMATGLAPTDSNWAFSTNYDGDLFAVCRSGASGKVEVHVLTAASNYQNFRVHAVTALHPVDDTFDLLVGPEDDLYVVKRQGASGQTEVHVMRASNSYGTMAFQRATGLAATGTDFSFAISANRDLCIAQHNGASGTTEIHVLTAETEYAQFGAHTPTGLHPIDRSWAFAVPQPFSPGFIARQGASGMTEVHVPVLDNMPTSRFQDIYINLFQNLPPEKMDEMRSDCYISVAGWGAQGAISGAIGGGGIPGALVSGIAGATAGALTSKSCRDLVINWYQELEHEMDHEEFVRMDKNNSELERWDRERDTA